MWAGAVYFMPTELMFLVLLHILDFRKKQPSSLTEQTVMMLTLLENVGWNQPRQSCLFLGQRKVNCIP